LNLFDAHCDTLLRCYQNGGGLWERPGGHIDLARTRKFGCYAQFFAVFGSPEDMPGKDLTQVFLQQHGIISQGIKQNENYISFCRSGEEAEKAFAAGKTAAFLSVEGGELLGCDIAWLERACRMGVRSVNITWNHANALSGSNAEERNRGLSEKRRAFGLRLHELGKLADLSHISDPGFWDVAEMACGPLFASHSNSRAVFFDQRNFTEAQFTAIIRSDGAAGINMYAAFLGEKADLDTVVAHIDYFLSLGGEKNICIGGDWDGMSRLPKGMDGIWDMDRLYERLLQKNYSETLVNAVFFTNLMRVVNEVCTI